MNKKMVYTCETCSALYVCLKYFQEHRKKHASQDGQTIFPCSYCDVVHTSEHESHLHNISHRNDPPHSCDVCQVVGISEEVVLGSRRSIGTATDFHVYNISLDKPLFAGEEADDGIDQDDEVNHDSDEEQEDDDNEDEDEDDEDEEGDEDEDGEEDDANEEGKQPIVTNIIYVTNQTINHNTSQKNYLKASRPSRSTGKGKGNRNTRITGDGDGKRKFSCSHCGKSFKTKSHLQRHILTHTGEKPYTCNKCHDRFNQSSSLRNHMIAIHTKEFPHICNNCSKGFLMPALLNKHLQSSDCGRITNQVVDEL